MKNFRKILTAFLLVVSVFAVTACSKKAQDNKKADSTQKTETTQKSDSTEKKEENKKTQTSEKVDSGEYKLLKTFELKKDGSTVEISYYGVGDIAFKQTAKNELLYKVFPGGTKETAEQALKSLAEQYKGLNGITHKLEFKEDRVLEELEVNYKELDFEKAKNIPGMSFTGDPKNGVNVTQSGELLKKNGFVEKK